MKKLVSLLTAFAMMFAFAVPAFASGIFGSIDEIYDDDATEINIIYNGQLITYDDVVPEDINDRVMLPFRKVLETMGATVEYDEATNSVSAVRGDMSIAFTIGEDTISVNNGGVESVVKSDVPIIEKNDRTLVPVRFISNALGMRVGWDEDMETVLIVDIDSYIDKLNANTPNFQKMFEQEKPEYNTGSFDVSFDINTAVEDGGNISLKLPLETKTADGVTSLAGKISFDANGIGDVEIPSVKDAAIDIILSDAKIYAKTDIFSQLLKEDTDNAELKLAASLLNNRWFSVDLKKAIEFLAEQMPENTREMFASLLKGEMPAAFSTSGVSSWEELFNFMSFLSNNAEADVDIETATVMDMLTDVYIMMDKYITVTENSVSFKIDIKDFAELMQSAGAPVTDEEISDFMDLNVEFSTDYNDNQAETKINMSMGIDILNDEKPAGAERDMKFSFIINSVEKNEENLTPAEIPTDAVDLMEVMGSRLGESAK